MCNEDGKGTLQDTLGDIARMQGNCVCTTTAKRYVTGVNGAVVVDLRRVLLVVQTDFKGGGTGGRLERQRVQSERGRVVQDQEQRRLLHRGRNGDGG